MASPWGNSWGSSWGNAWDITAPVPDVPGTLTLLDALSGQPTLSNAGRITMADALNATAIIEDVET